MSKDIVLQEREAWWCRECESIVRVMPGEPLGLSCGCGDIRDIEDIPDKFISCVVRVVVSSIDSIQHRRPAYHVGEGTTTKTLPSGETVSQKDCGKLAFYFLFPEDQRFPKQTTDIELLDGSHPKKGEILCCGNCGNVFSIEHLDPYDNEIHPCYFTFPNG